MNKKDYLDKESRAIHDEMREFFKPIQNCILVEYVENLKSAGGIFLTNAEKSIGFPVVAVGEDVKQITAGDWVMFKNIKIDVFEFFGRKWAVAELYQIASVINPMGILRDGEFKTNMNKSKEEEIKKMKADVLKTPGLDVIN